MSTPRQKTAEEIRDEFFALVYRYIDFYEKDAHLPSVREKLEGLVFSLMNIFDGMSSGIGCGFLLVPSCHPSDPDYLRENGENWYPVNQATHDVMEGEISCGEMLHDAFLRLKKPDAPRQPPPS